MKLKSFRIYTVAPGSLRKLNYGRKGHDHDSLGEAIHHLKFRERFVREGQYVIMNYKSSFNSELVWYGKRTEDETFINEKFL